MTDNSFFEAWDAPFGLPTFDRIRPEHFPPPLTGPWRSIMQR